MNRVPPVASPERNRFREIVTVIVAFGLTYLIGRVAVNAIPTAPTVIQLGVFVIVYIALYVVLWRVSGLYWSRIEAFRR